MYENATKCIKTIKKNIRNIKQNEDMDQIGSHRHANDKTYKMIMKQMQPIGKMNNEKNKKKIQNF